MSSLVVQAGFGSLPRLEPHRNAGLEIVCVLRGHLLWQAEGVVEPVPPGSVYFTLPWQTHGSAEEFEPGHEWVFVVLASGGGDKRAAARSLLHEALGFSDAERREIAQVLTGTRRHAFASSALLPALLREMVDERRHPERPLHEARVAALARAAVVELVRCVRGGGGAPAGPRVEDAAAVRVRRLVDELAADPGRPWTLEEMARACRLGRTRLTALLRAQTGDAPMRLLQRLRVRRACQLLRDTDWPVTRIAHDCGFGTSQYFAHVFKRGTAGMDARGYRARHRGSEKVSRRNA